MKFTTSKFSIMFIRKVTFTYFPCITQGNLFLLTREQSGNKKNHLLIAFYSLKKAFDINYRGNPIFSLRGLE